jgi:hypothetical protein
MPATLVLADHTGRLGNKLILFAHVAAAAEEYGCRVVNLSILPAARYFEGLHLNPWGAYPRKFFPLDLHWLFRSLRKPLQNWVRGRRGKAPIRNRWLTLLDMENQPVYRMDSPEFAALTRQSTWIILWGFPYRCPGLVKKHSAKIREFFRIRPQVAPVACEEFAAAKESGKQLLAIHIRQGDFREWQGGKYYLSPEEAGRILKSCGWKIGEPGCRVWVCSDEGIPGGLFPMDSVRGIPRNLGEDLFIMSACGKLVAGWSTLAFFCSFLGGNELYRIPGTNQAPGRIDAGSLGDMSCL